MNAIQSKPVWLEGKNRQFPALTSPHKVDAVVIGGGVTGLTAAYLAATEGKSVCLLERNQLASGESGHTTAHLTGLTDNRLRDLVASFGESGAALAWFAGFFAIEEMERIVDEAAIECDFRRVDGYLHESLLGKGDGEHELQAEVELAQKLGFEVDFVSRAPIVNRPAMRFRNQAILNPTRYLSGLAEAVVNRGGKIFEQTEVSSIEGDPPVVTANGLRIECNQVLIATHVPLMGKASLVSATFLQSKLAAYSSYVLSGTLPPETVPEVSLWDTSDPYFYLRSERFPEHDRIIFGGLDHKTGQVEHTNEVYNQLEAHLRSLFPEIQLDHRWSGQVIHTMDGLPYIGEMEKGQFIATGFNGNGFTFATIAALMFRDQLVGRANPWSELFSINRTILRSGLGEYLKNGLDYPYYMAADRLGGKSKQVIPSLKPGEGAVLSMNGQRVACSRDREGALHQVSATCPHLGCIVHWNDGEQTWDCPCHGSRFQPDGSLIAGPAETPLKPHYPTAETSERSAELLSK